MPLATMAEVCGRQIHRVSGRAYLPLTPGKRSADAAADAPHTVRRQEACRRGYLPPQVSLSIQVSHRSRRAISEKSADSFHPKPPSKNHLINPTL